MKFLIVFALCVAAATARFEIPDVAAAEAAEIQEILDMINHPNTDPATAAALEALLNEFLAPNKPIEDSIDVGPVIVENDEYETISVGPAIIEPIAPAPATSPLVQVIINVNTAKPEIINHEPIVVVDEEEVEPTPVIIVDEAEVEPTPVIIVDEAEVEPTPVIIVDEPEVEPTPVIIVDEAEVVDPVVVDPVVFPESGMLLPHILN